MIEASCYIGLEYLLLLVFYFKLYMHGVYASCVFGTKKLALEEFPYPITSHQLLMSNLAHPVAPLLVLCVQQRNSYKRNSPIPGAIHLILMSGWGKEENGKGIERKKREPRG